MSCVRRESAAHSLREQRDKLLPPLPDQRQTAGRPFAFVVTEKGLAENAGRIGRVTPRQREFENREALAGHQIMVRLAVMPQFWLGRSTRFVAQISNLLYRRIPFGRPPPVCRCTNFPRFADWKSIGNLRYSRARLRRCEKIDFQKTFPSFS